MTRVVVDASLAAMWAIPEAHSEAALELATRWARDRTTLLAPCLLLAELTNALHKRILRGELDLPTAQRAVEVVLGFAIELREEPAIPTRALELAHGLRPPTTYDCHYLALAERYDSELWTGDRRFYNAVRRAAPRVRWIGNA